MSGLTQARYNVRLSDAGRVRRGYLGHGHRTAWTGLRLALLGRYGAIGLDEHWRALGRLMDRRVCPFHKKSLLDYLQTHSSADLHQRSLLRVGAGHRSSGGPTSGGR